MADLSSNGQMTEPNVNTSTIEAKFKDQTSKDWTFPTPLDAYLKSKPDPVKGLKDLIRDYESSSVSLQNIVSEISSATGWVHNALPQFRTFANQRCLLLVGVCPLYGETIPADGVASIAATTPNICFTDVVSGSVGRIFGHTVSLCARKDCRKAEKLERGSKSYRACLPIGQAESISLFLATKLEVLIGRKDFGINFANCVAFLSAAQDIAGFLGLQLWSIRDPSIIGRASLYSVWLASWGLEETASELAKIIGRNPEDVYETLRQDIFRRMTNLLLYLLYQLSSLFNLQRGYASL